MKFIYKNDNDTLRGISFKKNKYYYATCMFETIQRQIYCGTNLELAIWVRMVAEYLEYGKLLPNGKYIPNVK